MEMQRVYPKIVHKLENIYGSNQYGATFMTIVQQIKGPKFVIFSHNSQKPECDYLQVNH